MSFHLHPKSRIRQQNASHLRQPFAGSRLQRVPGCVEQHIRHVDDQATRALSGLEHLVKLRQKPLTCLFLVAFRRLHGLRCLRSSGLLLSHSGSSCSLGVRPSPLSLTTIFLRLLAVTSLFVGSRPCVGFVLLRL